MSTEVYLTALRSGDYLYFLEWPEYIAQHYLGKDCTQDADTTISLIVFEWLQQGFLDDDMHHMAILYALASEENSLLQSTLSYAATALSAAAMQCMVFKQSKVSFSYRRENSSADVPQLDRKIQESHSGVGSLDPVVKLRDVGILGLSDDISNGYVMPESLSTNEVLKCIKEMEHITPPFENNQQLVLQESHFLEVVDLPNLSNIRVKIGFILILQDYIKALTLTNLPRNSDHPLRLGLAKALLNYARNEASLLSVEVQENIQDYINKIRLLGPSDKEENEHLANLSLHSTKTNLFWSAINCGFTFFWGECQGIKSSKQNNEQYEP